MQVFSLAKYLLLIVSLLSGLYSQAQQHTLLDRIIRQTQEGSVYRKRLLWDTLKPQIYAAYNTAGTDTLVALRAAVGLMLDKLDDNHSFILYKGKYIGRAGRRNTMDRLNQQTKNALKKQLGSPVHIAKLANGIAYISVPGMPAGPKDGPDKAHILGQKLRDSLCSLDLSRLKGIIVDLRLNTGGNMYPMIGGLGPLLGDGNAGSFIRDGKILSTWGIKRSNVYLGRRAFTTINNNCKPNRKLKIAVLIGPVTSSAGEATAISFIGKKNVKSFGEPTSGLITANQMMALAADVYYYLSVSTEADRNGKEYTKPIQPDELIMDGDNFENLHADQKVIAALKWLEN
ncbi:S41 family peptidase [Olivibacter sp. 47]|uniref:S41 family peptidase n=1 Tax=Olivibacter sp. 47 TaxID=3056486 RepID=UPI0025A381AD|nr:S41 family peptidase [Olivibacter sp. 47]MDM8177772.1 S41 family peptidase [Olivibacter sp. 47]